MIAGVRWSTSFTNRGSEPDGHRRALQLNGLWASIMCPSHDGPGPKSPARSLPVKPLTLRRGVGTIERGHQIVKRRGEYPGVARPRPANPVLTATKLGGRQRMVGQRVDCCRSLDRLLLDPTLDRKFRAVSMRSSVLNRQQAIERLSECGQEDPRLGRCQARLVRIGPAGAGGCCLAHGPD
jgi:hypothetical protein